MGALDRTFQRSTKKVDRPAHRRNPLSVPSGSAPWISMIIGLSVLILALALEFSAWGNRLSPAPTQEMTHVAPSPVNPGTSKP